MLEFISGVFMHCWVYDSSELSLESLTVGAPNWGGPPSCSRLLTTCRTPELKVTHLGAQTDLSELSMVLT